MKNNGVCESSGTRDESKTDCGQSEMIFRSTSSCGGGGGGGSNAGFTASSGILLDFMVQCPDKDKFIDSYVGQVRYLYAFIYIYICIEAIILFVLSLNLLFKVCFQIEPFAIFTLFNQ